MLKNVTSLSDCVQQADGCISLLWFWLIQLVQATHTYEVLCVCVCGYALNLKERDWASSLPQAVRLCRQNAVMKAYRHNKIVMRFPFKIDWMEHSCSPEMWLGIFFTNFTCAAVWWNFRLEADPPTVTELRPQEEAETMKFNTELFWICTLCGWGCWRIGCRGRYLGLRRTR